MTKTLNKLFSHLSEYREVYLFPLIGIAVIVGALFGVNWLSGRPVIEDPGILVEHLYTALALVLAVALTGITQSHLFGFRSCAGKPVTLRDDIFDAIVSCVLLFFFGHYLLR